MQEINIDIQIRFADVDSFKHVNNVNLQHYFDLGKTTYFEVVFDLNESESKQAFIIASYTTSFFSQVRFADDIYVSTAIEKIGNKSITLLQKIVCHSTGEVRAECRTIMVAFDFELQTPIVVPDEWRAKVEM